MKKNIYSFLLFFLIFFITAEIGMRIFLGSHTLFSWEMTKYAHKLKTYHKDFTFGFTHRPGKLLNLMNVEVSTNSIGLRDDEIGDDNVVEFAFLGDSLTFGWGGCPK